MSLAISVKNLLYRYPTGREALRNVSLDIETGSTVGLIGKNGAGKTTLAKHFNSLLKPTSGRVMVAGIDTSKRSTSEMARVVGYVFQNPEDQLFGSSVLEEVAFGPKNLGMNQEQIERQTERALSTVRLLPYASEHPYNMTYGQRKMLCLASIVAMDPSVVVMDEPNAGQDYHGLRLLASIIDELKRMRKTIVIISHDMELVASECDKAALMCDGEVIAYGSTREILSDPSKLSLSSVRPPQVTRLAMSLTHRGIRRDIMTVEEMTQVLVESQTRTG
jgi:energy-coupling factor transport system ATP-binding protein